MFRQWTSTAEVGGGT
jgi:hypothetical protein